jgi:hypothetical protein
VALLSDDWDADSSVVLSASPSVSVSESSDAACVDTEVAEPDVTLSVCGLTVPFPEPP